MAVTAEDLRYRFLIWVKHPNNSGISWGVNNYPSGADPAWFGGDTNGAPEEPYVGQFATPGQLTGAHVYNIMQEYVQAYARIKAMRISIIMQSYTGDYLIYQADAIAHARTEDAAGIPRPAQQGFLDAGQTVSLSQAEAYIQSLFSVLVTYGRSALHERVGVVCHNSCHSSCHSSRSRR